MKDRCLFWATLLAWCFCAFSAPQVAAQEDHSRTLARLQVLLGQHAQPINPAQTDESAYDELLKRVGDARIVLLGEATHGSAEFIEQRARITRRLILEKGFSAVVLESGWAPAADVNAYLHAVSSATSAENSMRRFERFPRWTWRNEEFAKVVEDWRSLNANTESAVSVYGMDLYELPPAVDDVIRFAESQSKATGKAVRRAYRCFSPYKRLAFDPQLYGRDVARGAMPNCSRRVLAIRQQAGSLHALQASSESFNAFMAARAVEAAEAYYRSLYMPEGFVASWNLRERFLADSIDQLLARHSKLIVWAHNTHQGDARATDQFITGELSLGQLMRERHGEEAVFLVGMTTYDGSVRAASGWATRDQAKRLVPAQKMSWPGLLHETGSPALFLDIRGKPALAEALDVALPDRAVGVNYFPHDEQRSHYFNSYLGRRFDALIHIDRTRALTPLR